ncbi:Uncharacterised protein [Starkeya nomas]|uniref:Uncharacterized protein n=1 Tax=Starkeya nomas TaxID=2666134 RepID=A0A5S9R438_9HYPH|nr:hypothetical protein [Starkeya nomas]CAA0129014.1 Uncharacterised protein [Starkeya nomas]
MKTLTLQDLTHDELLAWIETAVLARFLPGGIVRQADLLSLRHATLQAKAQETSAARHAAAQASDAAWDAARREKLGTRRRAEADLAHVKAEAAYRRAVRADQKADAEAEACWAALEAEWERKR